MSGFPFGVLLLAGLVTVIYLALEREPDAETRSWSDLLL